jgi:D-lactate dehydrogenase (cytochrome)
MLEALRARFGERCSTAQAVREQHGRDESVYDAPPEVVVFCESTADVAAGVVKLADAHAVPVIPFGVGSSLEGPPAGGAGRHQRSTSAAWTACCASTPRT